MSFSERTSTRTPIRSWTGNRSRPVLFLVTARQQLSAVRDSTAESLLMDAWSVFDASFLDAFVRDSQVTDQSAKKASVTLSSFFLARSRRVALATSQPADVVFRQFRHRGFRRRSVRSRPCLLGHASGARWRLPGRRAWSAGARRSPATSGSRERRSHPSNLTASVRTGCREPAC